MKHKIKLVAVDIDGTFVRSDYTYDVPRFQRIFSRMKDAGCHLWWPAESVLSAAGSVPGI